MREQNYWGARKRINRRQVLRTAAAGAGVAGLAALGCSTQGRGGNAQQSPNQAASGGQPVNGGTFVAALQANPQSLDPQRVSATAQVSISGVMSRVFRFKTSTNPDTATDHDIE